MASRETENNAYAKFWGDKQRALWYVMVFSGVVNQISGAFEMETNLTAFALQDIRLVLEQHNQQYNVIQTKVNT